MRRLILGPPNAGTCFRDRGSGACVSDQLLSLSPRAHEALAMFTGIHEHPEESGQVSDGLAAACWKTLRSELRDVAHLGWQNSQGRVFEPETQRIRSADGKLRAIGYWKGFGEDRRFPNPKSLIDPAGEHPQRDKIIAYLRGGIPQISWLGYSSCRFACGVPDSEMGTLDLSDGTWIWPQGLAHYAEAHRIRLPREFTDHMHTNEFSPPVDLAEHQFSSSDVDYRWWIDWGLSQRKGCAYF